MRTRRLAAAIALALVFTLTFAEPALAVSNAKPASSVSAYNASTPEYLSASNLYAQTAILVDGKTGKVLFSKNAELEMHPASTTKIMTALLVLENCPDLDKQVTITLPCTQSEASWIPVQTGEVYTIRDLLHALMLISANDAAIALAIEVSGSVDAFAELMTSRAAALGCTNTRFANANGLTDNKHYTTAADMVKIAAEAMKNEYFRKLITTPSYTLPPTSKRDYTVTLSNKDKFLSTSGNAEFSYEYGIGIKTGYTNAAQSAFVGAAEKDGVFLLSVVYGSTTDGKWLDTEKLMDYGFSSAFTSTDAAWLYQLHPASTFITGANAADCYDGYLSLDVAEYDASKLNGLVLTDAEYADLSANFESYCTVTPLYSTIPAPVQQGEVLATLSLRAPFMATPIIVDLVASKDVSITVVATNEPVITPAPSAGTSVATSATQPGAATDDPAIFANAPTAGNKKRLLAFLLMIPAGVIFVIFVIVGVNSIRRSKRRKHRARSNSVNYYTSHRNR